jgi:urease beta subunit
LITYGDDVHLDDVERKDEVDVAVGQRRPPQQGAHFHLRLTIKTK